MTVLIKGMEMPKEGTVIAIYKLNGQFFASVHGTELCPLIPVPTPHGRLIDAGLIYQETLRYSNRTRAFVQKIVEALPTVIEAEVEE